MIESVDQFPNNAFQIPLLPQLRRLPAGPGPQGDHLQQGSFVHQSDAADFRAAWVRG
jgi:hypothetical protein